MGPGSARRQTTLTALRIAEGIPGPLEIAVFAALRLRTCFSQCGITPSPAVELDRAYRLISNIMAHMKAEFAQTLGATRTRKTI
jgi:hypothetical protein